MPESPDTGAPLRFASGKRSYVAEWRMTDFGKALALRVTAPLATLDGRAALTEQETENGKSLVDYGKW